MKMPQMLTRLLLVIVTLVLLGGCVQPPSIRLEEVRNIVAHAYASGAAEFAPGEYQLSSSALQAAEQQIKNKNYREAQRTLELAQRYSAEALSLTIEIKRQLAEEQALVTKQKRLEQLEIEKKKQRELEEQQRLARELRLKQEQEAKRRKELLKKKQERQAAVTVTLKEKVPVPAPPQLKAEIQVQAGESLADIAARDDVYDDADLWPLIYKANRDQIKDPREIFVGQNLVIPRDKTHAEIDAARQEAQALNLF